MNDENDETRPTASALQEALNEIPRQSRKAAVLVCLFVALATGGVVVGVTSITEPGWFQVVLLSISVVVCGVAGWKLSWHFIRRRGPDALDRWIAANPDQSKH